MNRFLSSVLVAVSLALLLSCASTPVASGDLRGTWAYSLIDASNGNTWDSGTITFTGTASAGTWEREDYYQTKDRGSWTDTAGTITLAGSVTITAVWKSPNKIEGDWKVADGDHGTVRFERR